MAIFEAIDFVYEGHIRPYTRMTQASQHVNKAAIAYIQSRNELRDWLYWQCQVAIKDGAETFEYNTTSKHGAAKIPVSYTVMIPPKTPLGMSVQFINHVTGHGCDLDNLFKTVMDASNRIIFVDDRYVDMQIAERFNTDSLPEAITKIRYYPIGE